MRLIDADALELRVEKFEQLTGMKLDIVHDFVGSAPTIDAVDVVRGEWIISYIGSRKQTECSACGKSFTTYDVYGWNYCPWCGAKMKGVNDEVLRQL